MLSVLIALNGEEIPQQSNLPADSLLEISLNKSKINFSYFSMGVTGNIWEEWNSLSPDPFLGWRHFFYSGCALDVGVGMCSVIPGLFGNNPEFDRVMFYGQASCLLYLQHLHKFRETSALLGGLYTGAGFTCGFMIGGAYDRWWVNIPVTFGYQFTSGKGSSRFIQLQVTPLFSGTLSYGFGF